MLNLQKPASRAQDRLDRAKAKLALLRRVRRAVLERDGYRCRVCKRREGVDMHHLRFRSAGGETSTANCAALCRIHHDDIHAWRLAVQGDANGKLRVQWL